MRQRIIPNLLASFQKFWVVSYFELFCCRSEYEWSCLTNSFQRSGLQIPKLLLLKNSCGALLLKSLCHVDHQHERKVSFTRKCNIASN